MKKPTIFWKKGVKLLLLRNFVNHFSYFSKYYFWWFFEFVYRNILWMSFLKRCENPKKVCGINDIESILADDILFFNLLHSLISLISVKRIKEIWFNKIAKKKSQPNCEKKVWNFCYCEVNLKEKNTFLFWHYFQWCSK